MSNKTFVSPEIEKNTIEELSKQLIKANAELKKLQEEREIMFANISHDLRAPMTAIRSAVDLALSEKNPSREELRSTIELIDRRSKTLEALVDDMYFLYSVSNVPKSLEFEKIDASYAWDKYYELLEQYDHVAIEYPWDGYNFGKILADKKTKAVISVFDKYIVEISYGMYEVTPEEEVALFREELKNAGFEEVTAEIHKTIDSY